MVYGLGLISYLWLDGKKDIQSIKLAFTILQPEFKDHVLPPLGILRQILMI